MVDDKSDDTDRFLAKKSLDFQQMDNYLTRFGLTHIYNRGICTVHRTREVRNSKQQYALPLILLQ